MICPNCGTNVDERASFCPVCGTKLTAPPQQPFTGQVPQAPVPPSYRSAPSFQGGRYTAPIPNRSIALAIVLSIVTCGIYGLYWLYCIVNDLNTASGDTADTSGGTVLLLSIVTCGIYMYYWNYKAADKVNKIHAMNGELQDTSLNILYLILTLVGFGIVTYALIQNELNHVAGM